jgi:thiol-disulfide isomerase/thioredoxin
MHAAIKKIHTFGMLTNPHMKYILTVTIILITRLTTFSQNEPVPDYLTTQDFPDSIKALGMESLAGEPITFGKMLEMYKGKKVLIDIWASWCRDCIVGYPKLEALRKQVGEKNIAYVSLSVDEDHKKWKNAIKKYNIRADHYVLDGAWENPLPYYIALDWIPRYIVLDENGKIIVPKAVVADDAVLKKALK